MSKSYKIMFTKKEVSGSGGGGFFFIKNMKEHLKSNGYVVTNKLEDGIDLIFIIDPRRNKSNSPYTLGDYKEYKRKNPNVKILHRVNECDIKREVPSNDEPLLVKTMQFADHVVFISKWLRDYFINKYNLKLKSDVIINGCNRNYYYPSKDKKFKDNKIRLVTHHFSDNYFKGFHIYNELDKYLENNNEDGIEFTFIGNYNKKYKPKNIKVKRPIAEDALGNELRKYDIYLTATKNEPCGMHQLEGMSSGLPLLFCEGGGAIKETSQGGEEFKDIETLLEKIKKIKNNYNDYVNKIDYEYISSDRCSREFFEVIKKLL